MYSGSIVMRRFPSLPGIVATLMLAVILLATQVGSALAQESTSRGVSGSGDETGGRTFPGPGPTDDVEVLWTLDVPDGAELAGRIAYQDRMLVVTTDEDAGIILTAYDLADGTVLWTHEEPELFEGPSASDGHVYIHQAHRVIALDLDDGTQRWDVALEGENSIDDPEITGMVASRGMVYANYGDSLYALDGESGEEIWHQSYDGYWMDYRIVATKDLVIIGSAALDAEDNQTEYRLHALSRDTGDEVWQYQTEGEDGAYMTNFDGSAVFIDEEMWLAFESIHTVMLDAGDSQVLWDVLETCGDPDDVAYGVYGTVYACYDSDTLYDVMTGEALEISGIIPDDGFLEAAAGDLLYVSDMAGRLKAVNVTTGERAWSFDSEDVVGELSDDDSIYLGVFIGTDAAMIEAQVDSGDPTTSESTIFVLGEATAPDS